MSIRILAGLSHAVYRTLNLMMHRAHSGKAYIKDGEIHLRW